MLEDNIIWHIVMGRRQYMMEGDSIGLWVSAQEQRIYNDSVHGLFEIYGEDKE